MNIEEIRKLPIGSEIKIFYKQSLWVNGTIYRVQPKGISLRTEKGIQTILWKESCGYYGFFIRTVCSLH